MDGSGGVGDVARDDDAGQPVGVGGADRLLAALLTIDPDRARAIRSGTARSRPRPQVGPSAEHGD